MRYRLIYPWDERGEAAHGISAPIKHFMKELRRLLECIRVFEAFALLRLGGNLLVFEEFLPPLIVSHVP